MFIDVCAKFGDMLLRNIQEVGNGTNKNVNNPFITFNDIRIFLFKNKNLYF